MTAEQTARWAGDAAASALCAEYERWLNDRGVTIHHDAVTGRACVVPGEWRDDGNRYWYWHDLTSEQGVLYAGRRWRDAERWVAANVAPVPRRFLDSDNYTWGDL